jgi:hypothetical protein
MLSSKVEHGYFGLVVKPTFDSEVDAVNKKLRVPVPDRAAKRKAYSLYRNAVLDMVQEARGYEPGHQEPDGQTHEERMAEIQRMAAAEDIAGLEHALSGDTVPLRVTRVGPSPAADDAEFTEMAQHAERHAESERQQAIRHRVDRESQLMMEGARQGSLSTFHFQGRGNAMLQGEIPIDTAIKTELEEAPVVGHAVKRIIPRAAPVQAPYAKGYTAHKEFLPFRELNWGLVRMEGRPAEPDFMKQGNSYESFRRAISSAHQNHW